MILDPETWAEIRRAYEETVEPVRGIAARFQIARSTVQDRAAREQWSPRQKFVRRVSPPAPVYRPRPQAPPPATPPRIGVPPSVVGPPAPAPETVLDDAADPCADPGEASSEPIVRGLPRPPDAPAVRIERFYRIIDRLLEKMEQYVSNTPDMPPQDQERHARALASTLTTFERVSDVAGEALDLGPKPEGETTNGSAEADRMRREIAERLERLSAKWLAGTKTE